MTRSSLCFLFAVHSTVASAAPLWQDEVLAGLVDTDPGAAWEIVPVTPTAAGRAKADILIEAFADGSTGATWLGDAYRFGGVVAATSLDGAQALLVADSVLFCDGAGCGMLPSIEPDEIDFQLDARKCAYPMCGGFDVLAAASPAYLIVDVAVAADGSTTYTVSAMLLGFGTAVTGVEPDEID